MTRAFSRPWARAPGVADVRDFCSPNVWRVDSARASPLRRAVHALLSGTASRRPWRGFVRLPTTSSSRTWATGQRKESRPWTSASSKRGCIRDDLEYYLVNGIVVDLGNTLPDKERAMLW